MLKERYQNPTVGDTVNLRLFTYNSNNRANVSDISKVEIYFLDPHEKTTENPTGQRLVSTITDITDVETGQYLVEQELTDPLYVIGNYLDVWYLTFEDEEHIATVANNWQIYPDLWMVSEKPIIYDFNFGLYPNKIRKGSKRWLIVTIEPQVPNASDADRYYQNIAIVNPIKISMKQTCGECLPKEEDLRLIVDEESVEYREKGKGFYFLDTTEMDLGNYDVWFTMEFGENIYISDVSPLQIY